MLRMAEQQDGCLATLTSIPGCLLGERQVGYLDEATIVLALVSQLNLIPVDIRISDGSWLF